MSSNIKSFVSETQIEEKRKARQEEWERVRKPEDPVKAPEEEYDPRSLYDRLKEQRDKKQEEFEEQLKFKNHFRGINREESEFLSDVNKRSFELEKQKILDEKKELQDFKNAVAQSRELPEIGIKVPEESNVAATSKKPAISKKSNQLSILKTAVKRKSDTSQPPGSAAKVANTSDAGSCKNNANSNSATVVYPSVTKCVGILPGLTAYEDNSDDSGDGDSSSSDDDYISNNLLSSVVRNE